MNADHSAEGDALPWGESPYDQKTPAVVVHDYVMVRGDLSEQYARDQLAAWIERYAVARAHTAVEHAAVALDDLALTLIVSSDENPEGNSLTAAVLQKAATIVRQQLVAPSGEVQP